MQRIDYVFNKFDKVYVSFSGGKDSGVMLNLVLDYMQKKCITKKIPVLFVDLEAQYNATIDYISNVMKNPMIDPYWICLPLNLRNAVSVFKPFWTCWDQDNSDKWVRDYPDFPVITVNNHKFDFFKEKMEFEELVPAFGNWIAKGKNTCCLVGIRSDESLNRWRTIASTSKQRHGKESWTTKVSDCVYNAYPIYDWTTEDIWTANGKQGWGYNPLYDMMYRAGVGIHQQRICQPYGDDQRIGLNLYRVIEPQTWNKVVNRVSGANYGNIYCGSKINGYGKVKLPRGHTWKSYTKLLLATLPPELSMHYKQRFVKFMRYWHKKGSPIAQDKIKNLPECARVISPSSTRGAKNKPTVVYSKIPDTLDGDLEAKKLAPTWRRMAICILKNDHLCKTLSFTQTKNQQRKISDMLEKYRNL